jgi:hypothetical protein
MVWALFYLVLEGLFLAKELAVQGWQMVKQQRQQRQMQQQPRSTTTTTAATRTTSTTSTRAPLRSSLRKRSTVVSSSQPKSTSWSSTTSTTSTAQPAFVVGEKVTLSYEEAHARVLHMTEAALDKMNSIMASSNVVKDQRSWKETEHSLQQFSQFTVKSLWDFVDSIQMSSKEEKKQLSNEALLCEKKIWDRLSHFETQSFGPIFRSNASNTIVDESLPLKVTETTIINSSQGTKRFSDEHFEA